MSEYIEMQFHAKVLCEIDADSLPQNVDPIECTVDFLKNAISDILNGSDDWDCEDFVIDETYHLTRKDLFE
jgi:hypothetical protein